MLGATSCMCDKSTCIVNTHLQLQGTGVGAVGKPASVMQVAHSTNYGRKQKPTHYQEDTGHAKVRHVQWQSTYKINKKLTVVD